MPDMIKVGQACTTGFLDTGPSEAVRHGGGRRTKNLQGEREKRKKERRREKETGGKG